jgi:hypothetical protein
MKLQCELPEQFADRNLEDVELINDSESGVEGSKITFFIVPISGTLTSSS